MNRPPGESAEVLLSICVITFQRIEGVTRLLSDLAGSPGIDSPQVEVLVIDNCPSEQTRQVVEGFGPGFQARWVPEPEMGASNARNRGVLASRGQVVWFLDDDVRLAEGWLAGVLTAIKSGSGSSVFAGRVVPDWMGEQPPGWVNLAGGGPESHAGTYVSNDYGLVMSPLSGDMALVGASMGFRRDVLARCGGFRADLCPAGSRHRLGGDTEIRERLAAAGESGSYVGTATVHHATPPSRLTRRYALTWSYYHGWSAGRRKYVRLARAGQLGRSRRAAELLKDILRLALEAVSALGATAAHRAALTMAKWMRVSYRVGRVAHGLGPPPDLALDFPWPRGVGVGAGDKGGLTPGCQK